MRLCDFEFRTQTTSCRLARGITRAGAGTFKPPTVGSCPQISLEGKYDVDSVRHRHRQEAEQDAREGDGTCTRKISRARVDRSVLQSSVRAVVTACHVCSRRAGGGRKTSPDRFGIGGYVSALQFGMRRIRRLTRAGTFVLAQDIVLSCVLSSSPHFAQYAQEVPSLRTLHILRPIERTSGPHSFLHSPATRG